MTLLSLLLQVNPVDWVELSRVLPYAGIATLFAIFALKLIDIYENRQDKRDAVFIAQLDKQRVSHEETLKEQREAHRAEVKERDEIHVREVRDRDEAWRKAIAEGRARQGETLESMSENMKQMTDLIRSLHTIFTTHDAYEREVWQRMADFIGAKR